LIELRSAAEGDVRAEAAEEIASAEVAARADEGDGKHVGGVRLARVGGDVRGVQPLNDRGRERRRHTLVVDRAIDEGTVDHDLRTLDTAERRRIEVHRVSIGERRVTVGVGEARVEKTARIGP
jgi:hypothetical protein